MIYIDFLAYLSLNIQYLYDYFLCRKFREITRKKFLIWLNSDECITYQNLANISYM